MGKLACLRGTMPVGVPDRRRLSCAAGHFCRDNDGAAARTGCAGGLPLDGAPQRVEVSSPSCFGLALVVILGVWITKGDIRREDSLRTVDHEEGGVAGGPTSLRTCGRTT